VFPKLFRTPSNSTDAAMGTLKKNGKWWVHFSKESFQSAI
jgi:hypothetical protein